MVYTRKMILAGVIQKRSLICHGLLSHAKMSFKVQGLYCISYSDVV